MTEGKQRHLEIWSVRNRNNSSFPPPRHELNDMKFMRENMFCCLVFLFYVSIQDSALFCFYFTFDPLSSYVRVGAREFCIAN